MNNGCGVPFTQDCVEWDESQEGGGSTSPPSSTKRAAAINAGAEIEDLMKMFGDHPSSKNHLARASTYPPQKRRRQRTMRPPQRGVKMSSTASLPKSKPTLLRRQPTDTSFDDLIKQLDEDQPAKPKRLLPVDRNRKQRKGAHHNEKQTRKYEEVRPKQQPRMPERNARSVQLPPTTKPIVPQSKPVRSVDPIQQRPLPPIRKSRSMPTPQRLEGKFKAKSETIQESKPISISGSSRPVTLTKEQIQRMEKQKQRALALRRSKSETSRGKTIQSQVHQLPSSSIRKDIQDDITMIRKRQITASAIVGRHTPQRVGHSTRVVAGEITNVTKSNTTSLQRATSLPETNSTQSPQNSSEFDDIDFSDDVLAELDLVAAKASQAKQNHKKRSLPAASNALNEQKKKSHSDTNNAVDMFDDLSDGDFDDAFNALEGRKAQPIGGKKSNISTFMMPQLNNPVRNSLSPDFDFTCPTISFSRYQVVEVVDDKTTFGKGLLLKAWNSSISNDAEKYAIHHSSTASRPVSSVDDGDGWVYLRGEWYHSKVFSGDIVHLCSLSGRHQTNTTALPVVLHTDPPAGSDFKDDLVLIIHPDTLISPTTISETIGCNRRAVVKSRLGSSGLSSKAALFGTMRHDLFERCMREQVFDMASQLDYIDEIAREKAEDLVALGIRNAEATKELTRVLSQIHEFRNNYTDFGTRKKGVRDAAIIEGTTSGNLHFLAHSIESAEESLVSHELGLKGNIDATVEATAMEVSGQDPRPTKSIACIELKTGHNQRPQHYHMAQLALYILLLQTRYRPANKEVSDSGMLLYMNNDAVKAHRITPMVGEIKSLVGQRNLVATELRRSLSPRGIVLHYESENGSSNSEMRYVRQCMESALVCSFIVIY